VVNRTTGDFDSRGRYREGEAIWSCAPPVEGREGGKTGHRQLAVDELLHIGTFISISTRLGTQRRRLRK
jgi:hypothetical protein